MGITFSWAHRRRRKPGEHPFCTAVIVAAGSGQRMGGIDKIMANLGDRPVIVHTIQAFQNCPLVQEIVVVTREERMGDINQLVRQWNCTKVSRIVRGGESRMESVAIGIGRADERARLIAIHDGARPLVSQSVLTEVIAAAGETSAAAPAISVKDTIKEVDGDSLILRTVPRETLRAVQTPQVFDRDLIKAALFRAKEAGESLTDDCAAVEAMGMKVKLTSGSERNIKITTPIDLALGEVILCQPE